MKTNLIVSLLAICLVWSCKSTTTTPDPVSNTTLITGATWQPSKVSANVGIAITAYTKGGTGNLIDFAKYRLTLGKDGKFNAIDNFGVASSGTWKFTNSEKSFELTDGTTSEVIAWDITGITATTLNVSHVVNITKPSNFDKLLINYGTSIGVTTPAGSALIIELIPQ